jgi:hypothetical protein
LLKPEYTKIKRLKKSLADLEKLPVLLLPYPYANRRASIAETDRYS